MKKTSSSLRAPAMARSLWKTASTWMVGWMLGSCVGLAQQVTTGRISGPGETDEYVIQAPAGTWLHMDVRTPLDGLQWRVEGPFREVVSSQAFTSGDAPRSAMFRVGSGEHRLRIAASGDVTGDYAFRLVALPSGGTVQAGVVAGGDLSPATATAYHTFQPAAGDRWRLTLVGRTNVSTISIHAVDPFGNVLGTASIGGPAEFTTRAGLAHTLLVEGGIRNTGAGSYGVQLSLLGTGPLYPEPSDPLQLGVERSVNSATAFTNRFAFTLATPTLLAVNPLVGVSGDRWRLEGPGGVHWDESSTSGLKVAEVPSGEYRLTVWRTAASASPFRFVVQDVVASAPLLTPGELVSETNRPAGRASFRRMALQAGDGVVLLAEGASGFGGASPRWDVLNPDGGTAISGGVTIGGGFFDLPGWTAPVTGSYWLVLNAPSWTDAPEGVRRFRMVPRVERVTDLAFGQEVSASVESIFGTATYRLQGMSGRRVLVDVLESSPAAWSLIGPRAQVAGGRLDSENSAGLTLPEGDSRLVFTGSGRETPSIRFRMLDLGAGPLIGLGSTQTHVHVPQRGAAVYRISLAAGQRLVGRALASAGYGSARPRWVLLDPEGRTLWNTQFSDTSVAQASMSGVHALVLQPPVEMPGGGAPSETFSLQAVRQREEALVFGGLNESSISGPGETVTYRFRLDGPERVALDPFDVTPVQWDLRGPDGSVGTGTFNSDTTPQFDLLAGDYRLVLSATGHETPAFRFRLLMASAGQGIAADVTNRVVFPSRRESRYLRLPLTAGERFFVDARGMTGFSSAPNLRLTDPVGNALINQRLTDVGPLEARVTGVHDLLLSGGNSEAEGAGQSEFVIWKVPTLAGAHVPGTEVAGAIAVPGQRRRLQWTQGEARHWLLDVLASSGVSWELRGAWGQAGSGALFSDSGVLAVPAGPAEMELRDTGDSLGSYRFRLVGMEDGPVGALGVERQVDLSPGSGLGVLAWDVAAGQRVTFRMLSRTGLTGSVLWSLYDARFNRVHLSSLSTFTHTALDSGRLYLVVSGAVDDAGAGSVRLITEDQGIQPPVPFGGVTIALGDVVGASPGTATTNAYRLVLGRPVRVGFDVLKAGAHRWMLRDRYATRVSNTALRDSDTINRTDVQVMDLEAGEYEMLVWGAAGEFRFRWLDVAAVASVALAGVEQVLVHEPGNSMRIVAFDAERGSAWSFEGGPRGGFGRATTATLFRPSGAYETWVAADGFHELASLLESGRHLLVLSGSSDEDAAVGTNRFRWFAPGRPDEPLTIGVPVEVSLDEPGRVQGYRLVLAASRRVQMDALGAASGVQVSLERGGVRMLSGSLNSIDIDNSPSSSVVELPAGEYRLTFDASGAARPRFRFVLREIAGGAVVPFDVSVVGTNRPANATVYHAFEARAGESYLFEGEGSTGFASTAWAEVIWPVFGGAELAPLSSYSTRVVAPRSGTAWLAISGTVSDGAAEGVHRFRWWRVVDETNRLTLGVPVEGRIAQVGQVHAWTFRLQQPRRIVLDSLTNTTAWLRLSGTAGDIRSGQLRSLDDSGGRYVLDLEAGDYQVSLSGAGVERPAYAFRVLDVTDAPVLEPGVAVRAEYDLPRGAFVRRFQGNAGDVVFHDMVEYAGFPSGTSHRLMSVDGEALLDTFSFSDAGSVRLPYTGDYYFISNAPDWGGGAVPTYRFRLVTVPPPTVDSLLGELSLPDLVVEGIEATPDPVLSGGLLTVRWRVANRGVASAVPGFIERVVIRGADGAVLATTSVTDAQGNLAPGASRSREQALRLPDGPAASGVLAVEIAADVTGAVREANGSGTGEANNLASAGVTGVLAPYPDLLPLGFGADPAAWAPGVPVTLRWRTRNAGTSAAAGPWVERLVVSNASRRAVVLDVSLPQVESIEAGGERARSHTFTLPSGANGYGRFVLGLALDAGNGVAEYNASATAESNNGATASAQTGLDLRVTRVDVPLAAEPGVAFPVVHSLSNASAIPASGVLLDLLRFVVPDGTEGNLAQSSVPLDLPAGGARLLTNQVTLPPSFPHHRFRIAVDTDATDVLAESDETNNRGVSGEVDFPPVLTFVLSPVSIREDASVRAVRGTVIRNGPRDAALTVAISGSDPTELAVPASVTIPAGASEAVFDALVQSDGVDDGDQRVVVRVSAAGFRGAESAVTVVDADVTRLSVVAEPARVTEGGSATIRVARNLVTPEPMRVQVVSADTAQLTVPGSVIIPGGAAEATFLAQAVDDDLVERTNTYAVTVSAPGVPAAAASVTVLDNDLPAVVLALSRRSVSEGAGANAAGLTIRRNPVTAQPLTIALESAQPSLVRVPASVVIPGGQAEVSVPVGVIDNAVVGGTVPVAIGGFVLDASTRTPVGELAPELLTVTDDDGPTLTLTLAAEAVGEGAATTGTVVRNTAVTGALVVTLSSSDPGEATVPPTVTIPAGQDRVTFDIASVADGITDGNQSVTLAARAAGHADGTAVLVVSDADRPDLVVASLRFPTNAVGGESIPVTIRVENRGAVAATGAIVQRLLVSSDPWAGGDTLAGQISYPGPVLAGGAFEQTLNVRLPDQPGAYYFVAEADVTAVVGEILESNNVRVSGEAVRVEAAYSATVETDVVTALAGSAVPLRGRVLRPGGVPAPLAAVSIHVVVRGVTRTLPVVSGPDGRFEAVFQPLPTEGGVYRISAAHPGMPVPAAQDEFRLLGLVVAPLAGLTVPEGGTVQAEVQVQNRSDVELTGLTAEVVTLHPSLRAVATLTAARLAGDGSVGLRLEVSTVDTSAVESNLGIRVRSAEGAEGFLTVRVRQEVRVPRLVAVPGSLDVAMVRGRQTPVAFTVRNDGGLDTGPLRIDLPSSPWLALSSPAQLASLAPGSNTVVTLLLTPPADLPLGDHSTVIALNSERATLAVPARFRAVSDGIGELVITAEDEYTYFAEGRPPLAGAEVVVRDVLSGEAVRTNRTGIDGRAAFPGLREAYYLVSVTADRHRPFVGTALVSAGAVTNLTAFLSVETIRYSFFVEPTTVEDRYTLRVESKFETQVPVPVVTVEPAAIDISRYAGEEFQIEVTVRNHGLIAAESVRLDFPGGARFTATPLVTDLGKLPPGASVTVPILIRRPAVRPGPGRGAGLALDDEFDDASCSIAAQALWDYLCGPNTIGQTSPFTIFQAATAPVDTFGCDPSELFTRVFEYRRIPFWTQPGADPDVAAFIGTLPTVPFNFAAMTTFWRMCRPAPDLGPLGPGRGAAAPLAGEEPERDVCAKVSLQLGQSAVLARDAFQATLEVENDTPAGLDSVLVDLEVRTPQGAAVTGLFGIRPPELTAFTGVDGSGRLGPQTTGRARWTLIPTLEAAPTNGPIVYLVSGTLSYRQDGTNISVPLAAAPITVYPQPELVLRYFHERDVYADDPFTPEIEPSVPYSLAVQALNVGFGDARGLRLAGAAPQVVDNEKGLAIEFKTLATQLEDQPLRPTLDIDLGQIRAGSNRIARWLFSSSVQGSFTNFKASFEHVDALGARRLSLVREVEIHDLVRLVLAGPPVADGRTDFLVNDVSDPARLPDALYLSDGSVQPVVAVTDAEVVETGEPGVFQVAVSPVAGWGYIRARGPEGAGPLRRVVRADGTEVPALNAWTTDRFILGGALRPIRANLFHLVDRAPSGTYRIEFSEAEPVVADTQPPVSRVADLPATVPVDFPVTWSGTDTGGSGIAHYDVYASVADGPFTLWLQRTPATSALYRGVPGRSYAFYSVAVDAAGNREASPAAPDARTTTTVEGNRPPVFVGSLEFAFDEGTLVEGVVVATDPDAGQVVGYEAISGAPSGFRLDPVTGRFLWNPGEADGPGTVEVRVRARDNGTPVAEAIATLRLAIRELNRPPTLAKPDDLLVTEGQLVSVRLQGSDPDLPAQGLSYRVISGPAGATVNAVSGQFTWRPRSDQGGVRHPVTVRVTDAGSPALFAEATFEIAVRDTVSDLLVEAGQTVLPYGTTGVLPISLNAPPDVSEFSFVLDLPADAVASGAIQSLAADVTGATVVPGAGGRKDYRLQLRPGLALLSTRELLRIGLTAAASGDSRIVRPIPEELRVRTQGATPPERLLARAGRIVLIGDEPVLEIQPADPGGSGFVDVDVFGPVGLRYGLEASGDLESTAPWSGLGAGQIPAGFRERWTVPTSEPHVLFRARLRE